MSGAEPPTIAVDTASVAALERIGRLDTHGHAVLSVYVDLDPSRFPTPGTRMSQIGSLLEEAHRQAGDRELERVARWLETDPEAVRGAHGLAIFSSSEAGVLEAVRLPRPVTPLAVVDLIPWLEPLAAEISPGEWGVAVISRRAARLLRGGPDRLTQFALIEDDLYRRHSQGGWSQARFQRGIEEQVAAHVRRVAERLLRAHLRARFSDLVIVCSGELRPLVERELAGELSGRLAAILDSDLEHASVERIARTVKPAIERAEGDRERALIARLQQGLGTGGPAAAGLDEVLSTLEQERVATLLIPERGALSAGRCPICGRLSTDGGATCPLDGSRLVEVDALAYAVEEAVRQGADVVTARHQSQWLAEHGEIAAALRW